MIIKEKLIRGVEKGQCKWLTNFGGNQIVKIESWNSTKELELWKLIRKVR